MIQSLNLHVYTNIVHKVLLHVSVFAEDEQFVDVQLNNFLKDF